MQPADDASYLRSYASRCAGKAVESITNGKYSSNSKTSREAKEDELSDPRRRKCIDPTPFDPLTVHTDGGQEGETLATHGEPDLQGKHASGTIHT